jgi:RimJ/RimL family protein N-acetyltransferase
MEKMPYQPGMERTLHVIGAQNPAIEVTTSDWRREVPILAGESVTLRELRLSDAASLLTMLTTEEVSRFISPPPTTIEGFERFITWAHRERASGTYVCLAVVPEGHDTAIGIFQVRQLEAGFKIAEWGFALGSAFWGTGVYLEAAEMTLQFTFDTLGVHRLEARSTVQNGRGNGALRKIGAVREGLLRKSFMKNGQWFDQLLYSIIDGDWRARKESRAPVARVN